jgi:hypothetical protein
MDTLAVQYGRENFPMGALADETRPGTLLRCCNGRWVTVDPTTGELTWQGDELLRFTFGESDAAVQATERHSRKAYPWTNGPVAKLVAAALYSQGPAVGLSGSQYLEVPFPQQFTLTDGVSFSIRLRRTTPVNSQQTVVQIGGLVLSVNTQTGICTLWVNGVAMFFVLSGTLATINWVFFGITLVRVTGNGVRILFYHTGTKTNGLGTYPVFALPTSIGLGGPSPLVTPPPLPHLVPFQGEIADFRLYSTLQDANDFDTTAIQATPT